ncbi:3'-5' exonuclease [Cupriavidus taiwanensis]|uniref:3'-5' exonuclease n=1 Tax=Cupriavidus taiwanensis TaxID=164546 RepID=UPI000E20B5CF|nr:3'-5' exonuclease [Cupriavidus taiwanensis]
METIAILDFETTGLSPTSGDRATEIAVLLVRNGQIVDRFQSLMNAGKHIPADVVRLTGITNEMISSAPRASKVMREAAMFVGKHSVIAHNASFDRRFWKAELEHVGSATEQRFACTMLAARRIYPHAPNHKLPTLADMLKLPKGGRAHRAMADAEMANHLLSRLQRDIACDYNLRRVNFDLIAQLQITTRAQVPALLQSLAARI